MERYTKNFKHQTSFIRNKKHHMKFFSRFYDMRLADITSYELERFKTDRMETPVKMGTENLRAGYMVREKHPKMPRKRSNATLNRELSTLRHMFSKAEEWGMVEQSPFRKAKKLFLKGNNKRVRFLDECEETALFKELRGYLAQMVTIAIHTGMRRGEILQLKWGQIRNGFIYLTKTKTEVAREVPINKDVQEVLNSIPHHIKSDYVFCNPGTGKPYEDIKKRFNTAVKRAGIKDFRFHDLRHTFASRLVMANVPLQVVQKLLGHSRIDMTLRYAHLSDDSMTNAVKMLEKSKNKVRADQEEKHLHGYASA